MGNDIPDPRDAGPSNTATDDTLAPPEAGPRPAGASVELGQTVAAGDPGATLPGEADDHPVVVRSGRTEDQLALPAIDPQRYQVGQELARGGMGRILAARDRRLGRTVAIKQLLNASAELRARFEREARITAKLQHPAIVNLLEAGTWADGEPVYVMKLVTGESLDKAIAGRSTLEARLALVPNVIAAVDALAYAHSVRVIHRDLKPANVLVGEFGETVVIDWGLAKDLTETAGAPDVAVGPYRAALEHTQAGSIMGTPAYMPVEQARGEAVDERADVYSLGAMLYHVLTGAPPYTGNSIDAILDAVIAGPPPGVDTRVTGVPPDLVAIVNKAMAPAARDRYPTAKQLAEDLKKFQTGQLVGAHQYSTWQLVRRWARRHRTPLAVAAAAIVLLGVLGGIGVRRLVREQARTEQSRRDAEELMSFMLIDLRDKLLPLGRMDLLDDVATKAVAYYDQRDARGSDAELAMRARARRNLGDVLTAQGSADEALRQYRAAMAIATALAAADPTNVDRQLELATLHGKLGEMALDRGDGADALAESRAALAIATALAASDPDRVRAQRNLAIGHSQIGDVLFAQGDSTGTLAEYRAALAIREGLAASDPTSASRKEELMLGHIRLGDVLGAQGDSAGALAQFRAALVLATELVSTAPKNAEYQRNLWISDYRVGDMLLAQGDAEGALGQYRAASAIATTLAANDPLNLGRQRDLSISQERIGDAMVALGDAAGALAAFRAEIAITTKLTATDPTNAEWQHDLWVDHSKVGDVLLAQGDAAGAISEYRALMTIARSLVTIAPTNMLRQQDLAVSHDKLGDVLLEQREVAGALAEYRASLAIREALAAAAPTAMERQRDLTIAHANVGATLLAQGDAAGALEQHRAALAIREALAAAAPTDMERQRDLSISHDDIGDVLLAQGDAAGALAQYRASMDIASRLASSQPANATWQQDLATSHENVGDALVAQRDKAGGQAEYTAGLAIARRLQGEDPTNADIRELAADLTAKLATCCGAARTPRGR